MSAKYITAEDAGIDTDEGRFIIRVWDATTGDEYVIDIHSFALEFEQSVHKELRPYALEAEHARQAVAGGVTLDEYIGREPDGPDYDLARDLARGK